MERYSTCYRVPKNLCAENCPIAVIAGALLKDSLSGSVLAQLKLMNLGEKNLTGLKLRFCPYDAASAPLGESFEFEYSGLNLSPGESGGANIPVIMPESLTRAFDLEVISAAYSDESSWVPEAPCPLTAPESLEERFGEELALQYSIELEADVELAPLKLPGHWMCTCGSIMPEGYAFCSSCGLSGEQQFKLLDEEALKTRLEERLELLKAPKPTVSEAAEDGKTAAALPGSGNADAEEQPNEAESHENKAPESESGEGKTADTENAETKSSGTESAEDKNAVAEDESGDAKGKKGRRKKKDKKPLSKTRKIITAAAVLVLCAVFVVTLGIPGFCYGVGAVTLMTDNYDTAIDWYGRADELSLFDVFFNADYMNEKGVRMTEAGDLLKAGEYEQAAIIYKSLGETELQKDAYYQMGLARSGEGLYEEAVEAFELAGSYSDAKDQILKNYYLAGDRDFAAGKYESALSFYELADKYEDAEAKAQESRYCYAKELSGSGMHYESALEYEKLGDYKDSHSLWQLNLYEAAADFYKEKDYKKAASLYEDLGSYKDSAEKYKQSYYAYGLQEHESGNYKSAAAIFEKLGSYEDSHERMNASMYAYVLGHKSTKDSTTYEYLTHLVSESYKDSRKIHDDLYVWKITVTATNTSPYSSESCSISKWDTFYIHVKLSGGVPGDSTRIRCDSVFPNGATNSFWFDGSFEAGDEMYSYHWYSHPGYGSTGNFTARYYDGDGNLIGTANVYLGY